MVGGGHKSGWIDNVVGAKSVNNRRRAHGSQVSFSSFFSFRGGTVARFLLLTVTRAKRVGE